VALAASALAVVLLPRGASGTVEEQRARLPPPAECTDPVEGTWLGLAWIPHRGLWQENTLTIRRASPGKDDLTGDIHVHYWFGKAMDQHPPPCLDHHAEAIVDQPGATGKLDGLALSFGATTYKLTQNVCGSWGGYNPDRFSGTIDRGINEFQSVNNDNGAAVNEPVVFRRIKCTHSNDAPVAPTTPESPVAPPAYQPPKRGIFCGK
jgi:hypothetical protein